jgi:hypothetical protein
VHAPPTSAAQLDQRIGIRKTAAYRGGVTLGRKQRRLLRGQRVGFHFNYKITERSWRAPPLHAGETAPRCKGKVKVTKSAQRAAATHPQLC